MWFTLIQCYCHQKDSFGFFFFGLSKHCFPKEITRQRFSSVRVASSFCLWFLFHHVILETLSEKVFSLCYILASFFAIIISRGVIDWLVVAKMPSDKRLHTAAKAGDLAQVRSQVRNFDINAKGAKDGTPLYWAARNGKTDVVKLLLSLNADANIPDVSIVAINFTVLFIHLTCISPIPHTYPNPIFCISRYMVIS